MKRLLSQFDVVFSGLKKGKHQFDYELDAAFFKEFEFEDFEQVRLKGFMSLDKQETQMPLELKVSGEVYVHCDVSDEPFWMPLEAEAELMVKFGDEFDDSGDEILILPHGEHRFNVAQYFYELAALAKPLKVVHPDVENGTLGQEALERLEALSPENQTPEEDENDEVDPRWNKLKDLLN